ncbi:MAG: DUF547 domain-containing protein [Saprospiraceae bacterium]
MKIKFLVLICIACHKLNGQVDYTKYDQLLRSSVSSTGKVNYVWLKKNAAQLNDLVNEINNTELLLTNPFDKKAYWINVYNVNTLQLIVDHYPLKSIMDLDGGKTWDIKRIKIGNKPYSLNQIENEILRKEFNDARIHFALNCTASSCPPLLNEAYMAAKLEDQLDRQTRSFLLKSVVSKNNTITVSKLFEWYATDFVNIPAFINKYLPNTVPSTSKINYSEYDWKLNE